MRVANCAVSSVLLVGAAVTSFAQSAQTITGTVTDSMCGAHHMMKDASAAQCTRACVKNGADFALMSGGKMYMLKGDKAMIDKWAGDTVTVHGKVTGTTIAVDTMSAK